MSIDTKHSSTGSNITANLTPQGIIAKKRKNDEPHTIRLLKCKYVYLQCLVRGSNLLIDDAINFFCAHLMSLIYITRNNIPYLDHGLLINLQRAM